MTQENPALKGRVFLCHGDKTTAENQWASYRNRMKDQPAQNIPDNIEDFLKILNDEIKTIME